MTDKELKRILLTTGYTAQVDKDAVYVYINQLKEVIEEARKYNNQIIKDTKDFYRPTEDRIYSGDTLIDLAEANIEILDKVKGE